jgi:hypothetical protein
MIEGVDGSGGLRDSDVKAVYSSSFICAGG